MKIAVVGCGHGELERMYETIAHMEHERSISIDLLIVCGDFQAVRNERDLDFMACPPKYRELRTFHRFYSGAAVAPVLTLVIGGNHEASNHMWELPLGGWVAPNIYYLGYAGVVRVGGLRIGGLSGIFKDNDFMRGHHERPFHVADEGMVRSFYHVREMDVFRLMHLGRSQDERPIDVFLSHDWPQGIANYGNVRRLLQEKAFLRQEVEENTLGSGPADVLLHAVKPLFWFSAHLHVKFAAMVPHPPTPPGPGQAPDAASAAPRATRFLALDKCLPGRHFIQVVDVPAPADGTGTVAFEYDPEWQAILIATHQFMNYWSRQPITMPPLPLQESVIALELAKLRARTSDWAIPSNFVPTTPTQEEFQRGATPGTSKFETLNNVTINPQTALLCAKLEIPNPCAQSILGRRDVGPLPQTAPVASVVHNPDEISLDDEDAAADGAQSGSSVVNNPDEINLDDDVMEDESHGDDDTVHDDAPVSEAISGPSNPAEISLDDE
ncbi:lariat debranching enzyme [Capsaspora owczarzaki ATCC 30864]|uniref:lariat debranching enzyme n=1 Tax=Capsaspora owczarzaki (strain ATCC 30864) TaxID=595528 RepID=UPI0001FE3FD6|nr:lariat debranching enzyme [Capsaspora owczarzaki ATCC 30864]|eukprot:XP_004366049.1 lariat debranching enzyme [Capsaspora owczarzaki ATCC 30864]